MEPMLKVTDLCVSYGHVEALRGVSIQVQQGQIVSIIGANGAGKSTLLRTTHELSKINPIVAAWLRQADSDLPISFATAITPSLG